jgi:hypothetical protein
MSLALPVRRLAFDHGTSRRRRRGASVLAWCVALGCGTDPATSDSSEGSSSGGAVGETTETSGGDPTAPTDPTSADSTGDTAPATDTGSVLCGDDADCTDADAPFCEMGSCVACDLTVQPDASCAARDRGTPLCIEGSCGACERQPEVCQGATPICGESGACEPCDDHVECPRGAGCDILSGECLPADAVVYVNDTSTCPGAGTADSPLCSIQDAIELLGPGAHGTIRIDQNDGYFEPIGIGSSQTLALIGEDLFPTRLWGGPGDAPGLFVGGAFTRVYLHHLDLRSSNADTHVVVEGGTVYGTDVRIRPQGQRAIHAFDGASVRLYNATVRSRSGNVESVLLEDATLRAVNVTFIGQLGAAGVDEFPYPALLCDATSEVTIRNSIFATRGGIPGSEITCDGADITYSAFEGFFPGRGNVTVGVFPDATPEDWFADYLEGDFHLVNDGVSVFADIGQWREGDLPVDIDGDARPRVDGATDFPGADVP